MYSGWNIRQHRSLPADEPKGLGRNCSPGINQPVRHWRKWMLHFLHHQLLTCTWITQVWSQLETQECWLSLWIYGFITKGSPFSWGEFQFLSIQTDKVSEIYIFLFGKPWVGTLHKIYLNLFLDWKQNCLLSANLSGSLLLSAWNTHLFDGLQLPYVIYHHIGVPSLRSFDPSSRNRTPWTGCISSYSNHALLTGLFLRFALQRLLTSPEVSGYERLPGTSPCVIVEITNNR